MESYELVLLVPGCVILLLLIVILIYCVVKHTLHIRKRKNHSAKKHVDDHENSSTLSESDSSTETNEKSASEDLSAAAAACASVLVESQSGEKSIGKSIPVPKQKVSRLVSPQLGKLAYRRPAPHPVRRTKSNTRCEIRYHTNRKWIISVQPSTFHGKSMPKKSAIAQLKRAPIVRVTSGSSGSRVSNTATSSVSASGKCTNTGQAR